MAERSPQDTVQAACRQDHDVHSVRSTPRRRRPSGAVAALYLQALRTLLLGNASRTFSQDWAGAHFRFREPRSDLAYALEAEKVTLQRDPQPCSFLQRSAGWMGSGADVGAALGGMAALSQQRCRRELETRWHRVLAAAGC